MELVIDIQKKQEEENSFHIKLQAPNVVYVTVGCYCSSLSSWLALDESALGFPWQSRDYWVDFHFRNLVEVDFINFFKMCFNTLLYQTN